MLNRMEQFTNANRVAFDVARVFADVSMEGAARFAQLQLETTRAALAEAAETAKSFAATTDLQQVMALQTKAAENSVEKAFAYAHKMLAVTSLTQGELSNLLSERLGDLSKTLITAIDEAAHEGPAPEMALTAVKSVVSTTNALVDSMAAASKQVSDFIDATVKSAIRSPATVETVTRRGGKKH